MQHFVDVVLHIFPEGIEKVISPTVVYFLGTHALTFKILTLFLVIKTDCHKFYRTLLFLDRWMKC